MSEPDEKGGWVNVTTDTGYTFPMYIGESEDQPELEVMLQPPGPRLKREPDQHNAPSN